MKRFVGLLLTGVGVVALLWGGYHVLTGQSATQVVVTDTLAITAVMGGLIGTVLVSVGFVWMRD